MNEPQVRVIGAAAARDLDVEPIFSREARLLRAPVVAHVEQVGEAADRLHAAAQALLQNAVADAARIRREAHEQGRAEGLREALGHIAAATAIREEARAQAEDEMLELAFALASRVVARAVALDRSIVTEIVRERIADLRGASRIVVRVSPAAIADLEAARPQLSAHVDGVPLIFEADPALRDADCIVETESGRADGRIETQLQTLRQALRNGESGDE